MDSTNNNPLAELLEAVGRDTLPWDRTVEPAVAGQVVNLDERSNEWGMFPVVTIVTGDGRELEIAGMGAVLNRGIMTSGIEPGDYIAVRYLGQRTPRSGGKPYHDYKLVVRNSEGGPKRHQAVAKDPSAAVALLEDGFDEDPRADYPCKECGRTFAHKATEPYCDECAPRGKPRLVPLNPGEEPW